MMSTQYHFGWLRNWVKADCDHQILAKLAALAIAKLEAVLGERLIFE